MTVVLNEIRMASWLQEVAFIQVYSFKNHTVFKKINVDLMNNLFTTKS